jgi:hypothetical protein
MRAHAITTTTLALLLSLLTLVALGLVACDGGDAEAPLAPKPRPWGPRKGPRGPRKTPRTTNPRISPAASSAAGGWRLQATFHVPRRVA